MRSISTRAPLVLMAAGSMILLGGGVASACVTAHPGADQSPTVSKTDKPGDQTQGDKTQGDKTQGDKVVTDKTQGDKTQGDKVVTDKTQGDKTQGDKVVTDKTDKPAVKKDCNCHAKPIVVKKKDCNKPVVVVVHKKDCKKPVEHKRHCKPPVV